MTQARLTLGSQVERAVTVPPEARGRLTETAAARNALLATNLNTSSPPHCQAAGDSEPVTALNLPGPVTAAEWQSFIKDEKALKKKRRQN